MRNPAPFRLLAADDQPAVLEALRLLFKAEGYRVETASSPAAVLAALAGGEYDTALIDLNYARDTTSGKEGLELLEQIRQMDSTLPVIVMTAWSTVDLAVAAMRAGARDFVQKPWENARLLTIVATQVELRRALRRGQRLEAENQLLQQEPAQEMVARSQAMQPVLELIGRIGPSDVPVLITGENGTGKGVVARALHASSERSARSLVSVNAGGLSETLFESELFGHMKGAFTDAKSDRIGRFEMADGGTLFLDEIANVPMHLQSKLLRVLETGEFERVGSSRTLRSDARVLSATNADLRAEVESGRFRQDLLFRLNTIEIHLPPLRDRREDIPELAHQFLGGYSRKYRRDVRGFDEAALKSLLQYAWPGNVRELDHAIQRAVLLTRGDWIRPEDLGLRTARDAAPKMEEMSLDEVESLLIRKTLARFDGNVSRAAEALGLSRSALYRRLERYGLS